MLNVEDGGGSKQITDIAKNELHTDGYDGCAGIVVFVDLLVGATFIGPQVGELLHSATISIVGKVPLDRLWHAAPSFPTVSEVWNTCLKIWILIVFH